MSDLLRPGEAHPLVHRLERRRGRLAGLLRADRQQPSQLRLVAAELTEPLLHRRKQFIWYYQLTEEPVYLRKPAMLLTHTASLQITYNHTANAVRTMELSGIGSPGEVERIRAYLETRRLAERSPIRGSLT